MTYTREDIIARLEEYSAMREKIALLRYELEHPASISPEEMLQAMSFAHQEGMGTPTGSISNKTMYIAMNYQTETARQNSETMDEIVSKLIPLERKIDRLDYYLHFLEKQQREVIQQCYFQKHTLQKAAEALALSVWAIRKCRDEAVEKLTGMYNYVGGSSR